MIERLRIANFQKHARLTIDLDPSITTIVGPSDAGKSAIIRALRWVCFNKPDGDGFIRDGASFAKVQLTVDGMKITRARGKANKYTINGKDLVSFGRGGVPDVISDLLNMTPDNFQSQHDSPFWFSLSGGEVSRQLNAIVDLGIIDSSLSKAMRASRQAAADTRAIKKNLDEARAEKEALAYVPDLDDQYREIERRTKSLEKKTVRTAALSDLISDVKGVEQSIGRKRELKSRAGALYRQARSCRSMSDKVDTLSSIIDRARTAMISVEGGAPDTRPLSRAYTQAREGESVESLDELITNIKQTDDRLCHARKQLKRTQDQLPSRCPTCGSVKSRQTNSAKQ